MTDLPDLSRRRKRKRFPTPRPPKSKHWCFTINNYTIYDTVQIADFADEQTSYLVIGKEVGDDGTPHLQGYMVFKQKKRLTQVKKLMPRAHLEIKYVKSTPSQSSQYCMKDGDYIEQGTLPLSKEQSITRRWIDAYESAKEGAFEDIPKDMLIRYYHSLKRIEQDNPIKQLRLKKTRNVWIVAPTGYGKSYYARKKYPDFYDKSPNKWFVGYKGESVIICDDFGPVQCRYLGWYMKRWGDVYPFPMESKGGGKMIRPRHIIVTSQYTINECFEDPETIAAIHRRYKTKHLQHWRDKDYFSTKYSTQT